MGRAQSSILVQCLAIQHSQATTITNTGSQPQTAPE